jgi:hypothetical protein
MRWIVTDNIYAETWRNLLEFANVDLTMDTIVRLHGQPSNKSARSNYTKQARQARLCVLQAKEYFDAASSSSLFTSPNHAYYGAVSLASLCLLLRGDGLCSLDALRSDPRNNHHGLRLTTGCSPGAATEGVSLLEHTRAEVLNHGHFGNWYRSLPPRGSVYAFVKRDHDKTSSINYLPAGGYDSPPLDGLIGKSSTLLELLKYLPDLDRDLDRAGILFPRSRTRHDIEVTSDEFNKHTWFLHGCRTLSDLEALLSRFSVNALHASSLDGITDESRNAAIVSLWFKLPTEIGFKWPTSRETLNHDTISYATERESHEVVDLYLVAYQLSMLSRYYPDIWIACIESRCRGAKLIERAVDLVVKKLPILMLSLVSPEDVVISSHREPWK